MENDFKLNGVERGLCARGCSRQDKQLNTYDYLADIPGNTDDTDLVEVQFKNTRKGYYHNSNGLPLEKGDIVAVEASPGHDIGVVTLTGRLVPLQMKKASLKPDQDIKRVYRKAKPVDMEKYEEAKAREHETMIRSRQIAKELGLDMKIGDVEYQGDGNKAIFYYIADGRVDFRQLIKVLADAFRVRIEMKQIGARQEAGRIGGIGPCGRELCCATWIRNFVSVATSAARFQDITLNPQKLAGQCAKLKCCMNYEVDVYVEAGKRLPSREITLFTQNGEFYFFKADILAGLVTYSSDKKLAANLVTLPVRRVFEIINMNRRGEKPETLEVELPPVESPSDLVEQESLTRFDKRRKAKNNKKRTPAPQKEGAESLKETAASQRAASASAPKEASASQKAAAPQDNSRPARRETAKAAAPRRPRETRKPEAQEARPAPAEAERKANRHREQDRRPQASRRAPRGRKEGGRRNEPVAGTDE